MAELRREVIVPRGQDAVAFHRRIAILSICIAMLAGSLDAMLWRSTKCSRHTVVPASTTSEVRAEPATPAVAPVAQDAAQADDDFDVVRRHAVYYRR